MKSNPSQNLNQKTLFFQGFSKKESGFTGDILFAVEYINIEHKLIFGEVRC